MLLFQTTIKYIVNKVLFIIICCINLIAITTGQTIKHINKSIKSTNQIVIDTLDVVKAKAIEWFKNVYVEQNFKDPYSYQPLKTVVEKVTQEASLQFQIDSCRNKIAALEVDHSIAYLVGYYSGDSIAYESYLNMEKKFENPAEKKVWSEKAKDLHDAMQVLKTNISAINYQKELMNSTQKLLNSLSETDKKNTLYYLIRHDALLGKYLFKFDLRKDKGYDVVNLNIDKF